MAREDKQVRGGGETGSEDILLNFDAERMTPVTTPLVSFPPGILPPVALYNPPAQEATEILALEG